ncbi:hypothetical protein EAE96_000990 [Botrytis aclada]|nr:hypothetical protein EAE96_000990 [Botrytis aclada]
MELVGHKDTITHERIITNNPNLHEKKNLTFAKSLKEVKADIQELKRASDKKFKELKRTSDQAIMELKRTSDQTIKELKREKEKRYEGETANMRKRLWQMMCTKKELGQKILEPTWMKVARRGRNDLAHETDLETVMKLADEHPKFYDILLDTIYGAPKSDIKLLLDADKTGENQVYDILDERGSAFHNHYARTCVKPLNLWLSAVRCLRDIESASTNKPSSDYENHVQKQKAEVQKSIREWHTAFQVDRLN